MSQTRPDKLRLVADAIEKHETHFDMGTYVDIPDEDAPLRHEYTADLAPLAETRLIAKLAGNVDQCGWTACIAGWACVLFPDEVDINERIHKNAARILELAGEEDDIFSETWLEADQAVAVLRGMADGHPVWHMLAEMCT